MTGQEIRERAIKSYPYDDDVPVRDTDRQRSGFVEGANWAQEQLSKQVQELQEKYQVGAETCGKWIERAVKAEEQNEALQNELDRWKEVADQLAESVVASLEIEGVSAECEPALLKYEELKNK